MASSQAMRRMASPLSHSFGVCLDEREHKIEDFYRGDECEVCGLPIQQYWQWYMNDVYARSGIDLEDGDSGAASSGFAGQVAVSRPYVGSVERCFW